MADGWQQQVIQAQQGDPAAFDTVVKQFEDMAIGYAYSLLGDFHHAEDAAQEAFVEAYFCLANLHQPAAFPAWFRKIVFKQCDRIKRRKQLATVPLESTIELPHPGQTPLDAVAQQETQDAVLSAINALPEMERTVTSLAYINGYSLAEVGDFLEVPVSTVKNRLHTARKQLKERMVGLVEDTLKAHAPSDDFSRQVRAVLQGTRVGFFNGQGSPEDLMLPGVMRAIAEYLGNDLGLAGLGDPASTWRWRAYGYMAAVTGAAFRFASNPAEMTTLIDIAYLGPRYLDMFRDAFEAVGLTGEFLLTQEYADRFAEGKHVADVDAMRNRIKESIAVRQMPVVVMGVFGPPEPCIVTGYDDDGDVLIGWDHFQDEPEVKEDPRVSFEPSGCFRLRDWAPNVHGIYVITGAERPPARAEMMRAALERGAPTLRVRDAAGFKVGTASLEAWMEAIEHAGELDDAALVSLHGRLHHAIWDLAERRALGDTSLSGVTMPDRRWDGEHAAAAFGETSPGGIAAPDLYSDLDVAGDLMGAIHDTMYEIAEQTKRGDDVFDSDPQKLRDPAVRRKVIELIAKARTLDEQTANRLDHAIAVMRGENPPVEATPDLGIRVVLPSHAHPQPSDLPPAPERACLPSLLRMLAEFDGECPGYRTIELGGTHRLSDAYALFMGVSGEAFRYRDSLLHLDGAAFTRTFDRAFQAAGYDYRLVISYEMAALGVEGYRYGWDDNFRRIILRHIRDSRRPVLLFQSDQHGLITGYDHNAGELIGYGGSSDADAYWHPVDSPVNQMREKAFRAFGPPVGLYPWAVLVGKQHETADISAMYRQAVADAAQDMTTARVCVPGADGEPAASNTPYETLTSMLRSDSLFSAEDRIALASRHQFVRTFLQELAERRLCATEFLRMAPEGLRTDELLAAAALFGQISGGAYDLQKAWGAPEEYETIVDPGLRATTAERLEQISTDERKAASLLSGAGG